MGVVPAGSWAGAGRRDLSSRTPPSLWVALAFRGLCRRRYPNTEASAGHHSLNSVVTAGPISDARAHRKSKGSQFRDVSGTIT